MPPIRTVLWWNRLAGPLAQAMHVLAPQARVLTLDEAGPCARVLCPPVPGLRLNTLLPSATTWLEHGGQGARVGAALTRLVAGARPLRVLAAGTIAQMPLFAAALVAFRPDITALGCEADLPGQPLRIPFLPGCSFRCADALRPALLDALLALDPLRAGDPVPRHYGVDALACISGFLPPDIEASLPVAWTGPGRRAALMLPGWGGRQAGRWLLRLRLHASRIELDAQTLQLRLDGVPLACRFQSDVIEAEASPAPAFSHVLELRQTPYEMAGGIGLAAVEIVPIEIVAA